MSLTNSPPDFPPYLVITVPRMSSTIVLAPFGAKREPGEPATAIPGLPPQLSAASGCHQCHWCRKAPGRPDSRSDPRARRPAVTDRTSTGGVSRWGACRPGASAARNLASCPLAPRPQHYGVADASFCLRFRPRRSYRAAHATVATCAARSRRRARSHTRTCDRAAPRSSGAAARAARAAAASARPAARPQPRRSADRIRQGDPHRSLSAGGRKLPGHVRARLLRVRGRRRACAATLRRHVAAMVHAGDAGALERRLDARAADLLLPQCGAGLARRHRGDLERERLARLQRRRHRHLLGHACARSAKRCAAARPPASFRSSTSWTG